LFLKSAGHFLASFSLAECFLSNALYGINGLLMVRLDFGSEIRHRLDFGAHEYSPRAMGLGLAAQCFQQRHGVVRLIALGLTPEQVRQATTGDGRSLRFRETCLAQELLKFG